jgi:hypothetical protein
MCCGIFVGERLKEFDARHAADRERTIWSWHLLHHMCATNCRLKGRLLPLPWSHSADEIINIRKDLSYERTPLLTKPAEARLLRLYMVVNGIHFRQGCHFGHPQGKSRPKTSVWTFPAICTSGHSIRHVVRRWTTSPPGGRPKQMAWRTAFQPSVGAGNRWSVGCPPCRPPEAEHLVEWRTACRTPNVRGVVRHVRTSGGCGCVTTLISGALYRPFPSQIYQRTNYRGVTHMCLSR